HLPQPSGIVARCSGTRQGTGDMGRAKLNTLRPDEAVRLYRDERLSLSQVAARLGLTLAAVHGRLRRRGVPMRPQGGLRQYRTDTNVLGPIVPGRCQLPTAIPPPGCSETAAPQR